MVIAIFGRSVSLENIKYVQRVVDKLLLKKCELTLYKPFYEMLQDKVEFPERVRFFNEYKDIEGKVDFLFSIGGDGSILDAMTIVRDSGIPIMGMKFFPRLMKSWQRITMLMRVHSSG
jgi:NAD+ kinase